MDILLVSTAKRKMIGNISSAYSALCCPMCGEVVPIFFNSTFCDTCGFDVFGWYRSAWGRDPRGCGKQPIWVKQLLGRYPLKYGYIIDLSDKEEE